jgi:hypothetical protein
MPGGYPQVVDEKSGDEARIPLILVPGLLCDDQL